MNFVEKILFCTVEPFSDWLRPNFWLFSVFLSDFGRIE